MTAGAALVLRGVRRTFGTTVALDDAHCTVRAGTVHALLGENGAGKTTLMRIVFGLLAADSGELLVNGHPVRFRSSDEAIVQGIGMVHQHFMLVPSMTATENVALGGKGRLDQRAIAVRIRAISASSGLVVDPDSRVSDLPVGAQQRLEIVKALAHDARILILDEPTAVLTPNESEELAQWLRRYASDGGTVVLITHKLREALELADDVTVLRRGRTVLTAARAEVSEAEIVRALTGKAAAERSSRPHRHVQGTVAPVLALDGVSYEDSRGVARLRDVSLAVRGGEVLGVLGVEGSGQRELLRILAGRLQPTRGRVQRPERVGFIPEDRLHDALIPALTLVENVALADAKHLRGMIDWATTRQRTNTLIEEFEIRTAGPQALVSSLSGGNQQKFVAGRERTIASQAMVAENPTRGLDIRAAARVLDEIGALAGDPPPAVVFHSTDLEEVLAIATRVVVCYEGRVTEVTPGDDPDDRTPYTRAMTGAI